MIYENSRKGHIVSAIVFVPPHEHSSDLQASDNSQGSSVPFLLRTYNHIILGISKSPRSQNLLFNSAVFVGFFLTVYAVYALLSNHHKWQNMLLLIGSYVFYGWFDWRFLGLLAIITLVNFFAARSIYSGKKPPSRKLLLVSSIIANLAILGLFKYFNFFAQNFVEALNLFGLHVDHVTLNILLPVGLSFYMFQALGYTIDVFRGKLAPTSDLFDFALFVSFFPKVVAGPIERGANLLPQIGSQRKITAEQIEAAIFLILWGFFKKMVIADNLSQRITDPIFNNYAGYHGLDILIAILAFTVQIYCDFSGYTDIARGLCKLMGFNLVLNFNLPYFARNPRDFWSRWHISMSSWFRDYLYIPLGGNKKGRLATYRNLALTMLLVGLWHGAAWNFVVWGAYNGVILIIYRILGKDQESADSPGNLRPYPTVVGKVLVMFTLTFIGWTIFRSTSVDQVFYMLTNVSGAVGSNTLQFAYDLVFFSLPLVAVELLQYFSGDMLKVTKLKSWVQIPVYSFLLIGILVLGVRGSIQFIYFRF